MINEKKKKFCTADKHDEYTDLPVVLKSNALTFLEGTDIQKSLKIVLNELNMKIDEFVRFGSGSPSTSTSYKFSSP